MIAGALCYYQFHSLQNRLLARVRRLRQPKYLFGAIVGGLYFFFYIFRGVFRGGSALTMSAEQQQLIQSVATAALLIAVLWAWIMPHARAALAFTEAEVAFLFPAPISRQALIHFKLLKSQTAILFSSIFLTLLGRRWGSSDPFIRTIGWWLLFSTLNLHMIGSSFALTMLMDRGISTRLRRIILIGGIGLVVGGVLFLMRDSIPSRPQFNGPEDFPKLMRYVQEVLATWPMPYILIPFRMITAPFFAADMREFLLALPGAAAILGAHYLWVTRSNVAFEEGSIELSRKTAERVAAIRSGNWGARKKAKVKRPPFVLRPDGFPATAIFWKNLISAGQFITTRSWILILWCVVFGSFFLREKTDFGVLFLMFAAVLTGMSLFSGPQMMRNDLRQDLPATDVLKMYPMPGWQVVLGEVLAPAAILAGVQWLLIVCSIVLLPSKINHQAVPLALRLSAGFSLALILPCVDFIAMLIPNAAALFFPAWFHLGADAPRGFETTGQQLILVFGQLFILLLAALPAGLLCALILGLGTHFMPVEVCFILAAMSAAIILVVEAGIAVKLLGGVFERFDLSKELN